MLRTRSNASVSGLGVRILFCFLAGLAACARAPLGESLVPRPVPQGRAGPPPAVIVERDELVVKFAADGSRSIVRKRRLRIVEQDAIERWSKFELARWPRGLAAPTIALKVVDAAGHEVTQPADAIRDEVSEPIEDGVERKIALLDGVAVGSVIEISIASERPPGALYADRSGGMELGADGPVLSALLQVIVPEAWPLELRANGVEGRVTKAQLPGARSVIVESEKISASGLSEAMAPKGLRRGLFFTSVPSWSALASEYQRRVDDAIQDADVPVEADGEPVAAALTAVRALLREDPRPLEAHSIAPRGLDEVLAIGTGDAKDWAITLVAALRRRGVGAHVALISRNSDGADPLLPGIEAFDHALVVTEKGQWIEPTRSALALPSALQGRWALIAGPGTTGLVETPRAGASDNHYSEERTIELPAYGAPRIVETTAATGALGDRLRAQFAGASKDELSARLLEYVRGTYGARTLESFERGTREPGSFAMRVVASEATIGYTGTKEAGVQLRTGVLYTGLPTALKDAALAGLADDRVESQEATIALKERILDLELPEPYRAELTISVQIPAGFELKEKPTDREQALGPALYRQSFELAGDRVVARFSFDTRKLRYTADEARTMVQSLRDLWTGGNLTIELIHSGAKLMAAGRVKEGLAEYRQLADAHSRSAVERSRYAEALLEARLGSAARSEAEAAVAIDPGLALAHYTLGWVCSHDVYGRQYVRGYARSCAATSFLAVRRLEPGNREARLSLALLYEHDARGRRYHDLVALEQAIAEYEQLDAEGADVAQSLVEAHFWAGHFDAVAALAKGLDPSPQLDAFRLAAAVIVEGAGAALDAPWLARLGAESKAKLYVSAPSLLLQRGSIGEAVHFFTALAERSKDPNDYADKAAALTIEPPPAPTRPATVIEALLAEASADDPDQHLLMSLYSKKAAVLGSVEVQELVEAVERSVFEQPSRTPIALFKALAYGGRRYRVDGDQKRGWLVQVVSPGAPRFAGRAWLVLDDHGKLQIQASSTAPFSFGDEALDRLERGDKEGAAQVLDWARTIFVGPGNPESKFGQLWPAPGPRDPATIRVAAALLLALGPHAARAIPILEPRKAEPVAAEALAIAYLEVGRDADALPLAEARLESDPTDPIAYAWRARALERLSRYDEARGYAEARRQLLPKDPTAIEHLAHLAMHDGRFDDATLAYRTLLELGFSSPAIENNLAWVALLRGKVDQASLALAVSANRATDFKQPSQLHTLAALHAELGEVPEALRLLALRQDVLLGNGPEPEDWYVIGRALEGYGLLEEADRAYEKAETGSSRRDSTDHLATARRSGLGAKGSVP